MPEDVKEESRVLPLVFMNGQDRKSLNIKGDEQIDILGLEDLKPRQTLELVIRRTDGTVDKTQVMSRIDTADEVEYYKNGGILHYVLRGMAKAA